MTESNNSLYLRIPWWLPGILGSVVLNLIFWGLMGYFRSQAGSYYSTLPSFPVRVLSDDEIKAINDFNYSTGNRKVVQSDVVENDEESVGDPFPAEYLGERTQRVKKELMARGQKVGGGNSGRGRAEKIQRLFKTTGQVTLPLEKTDGEDESGDGDGLRLSADDLGKTVQLGVKTLLNTDEYKFYSYVNRIKESVYPLWKRNLDYYGRQVSAGEGHYLVRGTLVMTNEGQFKRIEDWKPCGIGGFDRSVSEAFESLPRIPNPPSDMIDDDELVRLKFSFRVEHETTKLLVEALEERRSLRGAR
jgi:hypothetical protein